MTRKCHSFFHFSFFRVYLIYCVHKSITDNKSLKNSKWSLLTILNIKRKLYFNFNQCVLMGWNLQYLNSKQTRSDSRSDISIQPRKRTIDRKAIADHDKSNDKECSNSSFHLSSLLRILATKVSLPQVHNRDMFSSQRISNSCEIQSPYIFVQTTKYAPIFDHSTPTDAPLYNHWSTGLMPPPIFITRPTGMRNRAEETNDFTALVVESINALGVRFAHSLTSEKEILHSGHFRWLRQF